MARLCTIYIAIRGNQIPSDGSLAGAEGTIASIFNKAGVDVSFLSGQGPADEYLTFTAQTSFDIMLDGYLDGLDPGLGNSPEVYPLSADFQTNSPLTLNAQALGVIAAHEIGHNLTGYLHGGTPIKIPESARGIMRADISSNMNAPSDSPLVNFTADEAQRIRNQCEKLRHSGQRGGGGGSGGGDFFLLDLLGDACSGPADDRTCHFPWDPPEDDTL